MPYSHLATATNILWKLLESYEHNPGEVFLAAGIEPDLLKQPGARIRYRAVNQAWQRATELIEDDCFGLQGPKFWHPSYLYGLGYAWLASHSLRESLQRFVRYLDIVSEGKGISLEEDLAGFRICFDFKSEGLRVSAQMDCLIAVIYHMCRLNFGEELQPLSVSFQHPPPGCADQYQRYFQAPVRFSAPGDCILFPLDAVEKTLPGTNPQFARMHDQLNVDYLARLREGSLVHRVKAGIIEALPSGPVANEKVARDLGMSVRSLQRRLAEAGPHFGIFLTPPGRKWPSTISARRKSNWPRSPFCWDFQTRVRFHALLNGGRAIPLTRSERLTRDDCRPNPFFEMASSVASHEFLIRHPAAIMLLGEEKFGMFSRRTPQIRNKKANHSDRKKQTKPVLTNW